MLLRSISGISLGIALLLSAACANRTPNPIEPSQGHLYSDTLAQEDTAPAEPVASIPEPVTSAPYLPAPEPQRPEDTYTVVVNQVPLRDLLFALARDAKLNIDIVGDIDGRVTLNAIDQTLVRILDRQAKLLGLDAPQKLAHSGKVEVDSKPDLSALSADELQALRALTKLDPKVVQAILQGKDVTIAIAPDA